ncbi:MAG: hypothetical protein Q7S04_03395 [Candidatus Moranbacteria bacterium]|nr:hypothetical protein [Candidatus Moranbacteria bacterium]
MFEEIHNNEASEQEEVVLKVIIQRHGPKLSASGEKNQLATYFADSVKQGFQVTGISEGEGLVHVNSSPVTRAADTAKIDIAELSHTQHRFKDMVVKKEALAVLFQPLADAEDPRFARDLERIVKMQKKIEPEVREEVLLEESNLVSEEKEAEIRNVIDMRVLTVLFNDVHTNKKTFETSYTELADKFAERYKGFLQHIGMLKERKREGGRQPVDEPYVQVDITHSFPVMCFLKKYLVFADGVSAESLSPEDFFERTGGIIRESGFMEMLYISNSNKDLKEEKMAIAIRGSFGKGQEFSGEVSF